MLNGSGVAGAAGRMTDKLSEAGYVVLSPENAPQRYSSSAVYYQEGWKDRAEEILQAAEIEEIEAPTAMPQIFASEEAAVIVLLGTDTAPAVAREQAGLRPRQRNDVKLPLPDSTPRDRYVPGLANVNIYTAENENDPEVFLYTDTLARALGSLGTFADERWSPVSPRAIEARTTEKYQTAIEAIEENLEWLGFTPQNTCGAPAGYSFTDLLQPTREWDENLKTRPIRSFPTASNPATIWHRRAPIQRPMQYMTANFAVYSFPKTPGFGTTLRARTTRFPP